MPRPSTDTLVEKVIDLALEGNLVDLKPAFEDAVKPFVTEALDERRTEISEDFSRVKGRPIQETVDYLVEASADQLRPHIEKIYSPLGRAAELVADGGPVVEALKSKDDKADKHLDNVRLNLEDAMHHARHGGRLHSLILQGQGDPTWLEDLGRQLDTAHQHVNTLRGRRGERNVHLEVPMLAARIAKAIEAAGDAHQYGSDPVEE